MSFNIGLSGLYAANKQLDVTGNNIANVATTGFKSSRAEFADVYSATKLGSGSKVIGNGVRLANVSQQFNQGDVNNTGNVLDMGIQGQGFFVLSNNGSLTYTRAGTFKTDKGRLRHQLRRHRSPAGLRCGRQWQDHQWCVDRPTDRHFEPGAQGDHFGVFDHQPELDVRSYRRHDRG